MLNKGIVACKVVGQLGSVEGGLNRPGIGSYKMNVDASYRDHSARGG